MDTREVAADGSCRVQITASVRRHSPQPGLWLDAVIRTQRVPNWLRRLMSKTRCCLRVVPSRRGLLPRSLASKGRHRTTISLLVLMVGTPVFAQSPPASPDRPWHTIYERQLTNNGRRLRQPVFPIDPERA